MKVTRLIAIGLLLSRLTATAAVAQTVPDLSDLSLIVAKEEASNAGLELVVIDLESTKRMGRVFDQIPAKDSSSTDGRVVVYVSQGVEVPNLQGKSSDAAFEELRGRGLGWDTITAPVSGFPPNTVGRQVPEHPHRIDATQEVVFLTLAQGVRVPDTVGKTLDQAFATLSEAGFDMQEDPEAGWRPGKFDFQNMDNCENEVWGRTQITGSAPPPKTLVQSGIAIKVNYTLNSGLDPDPPVPCPPSQPRR